MLHLLKVHLDQILIVNVDITFKNIHLMITPRFFIPKQKIYTFR